MDMDLSHPYTYYVSMMLDNRTKLMAIICIYDQNMMMCEEAQLGWEMVSTSLWYKPSAAAAIPRGSTVSTAAPLWKKASVGIPMVEQRSTADSSPKPPDKPKTALGGQAETPKRAAG
ncbi:hypothetical protein Taro_017393 [Colocasia esculenta]|uniref:Uncharacterized protein n=1 Tax=Colocasia esculenta TaxID=4460 RepID=A0A843UG39_COLES|nr:hypothetical protein [Colocasia esculenta]